MKLKYYLRGLGIGIIVTVIIMLIASSGKNKEMTEEEIIAHAEELGMVMKEEVSDNPADEEKETNIDSESETQTGQQEQTNFPEFIMIEVVSGEFSDAISRKVFDAKLVPDAEVFNDYLVDNGYDERIMVGHHLLPKGAGMDEIAKILCENPIEMLNSQ